MPLHLPTRADRSRHSLESVRSLDLRLVAAEQHQQMHSLRQHEANLRARKQNLAQSHRHSADMDGSSKRLVHWRQKSRILRWQFYPMSYILLTGLLVYIIFTSLFGLQQLGIWFFWVRVSAGRSTD